MQFWLTMGESSNGDQVAPGGANLLIAKDDQARRGAAEAAPAEDLGNADDLIIKLANAILKTKTRKFQTAKLIEDAASIRKTQSAAALAYNGFIWPLKGEFSSGYGYRRHPIGGGYRFHRGIDIAAGYGSAIRAAADGIVGKVYNTPAAGLGRHVILKHANGFETVYAHLLRPLVRAGQAVKQGEVIGKEGSSGYSTGPHLHFEIHKNRLAVDPMMYLSRRRR
jgi:murein DD-endopeptidase MepM/ murein hydrolase activator NlpD